MKKKLVSGVGIILAVLALFSCSKTPEEVKKTTAEPVPVEKESKEEFPEDYLSKCDFYISYSEVDVNMGNSYLVKINSRAEFAKFSKAFKDMPSEIYDSVLSDKNLSANVTVAKIPLPSSDVRYMVSFTERSSGKINVFLNEDHTFIEELEADLKEADAPLNTYAYVIFVPDIETYNGEEIDFVLSM